MILSKFVFLAIGNYFGATTIGGILNQWDKLGVFDYLLPFLLVFAVVFGILSQTEIFGGNRGVWAIISLAAGLLAIQFNYLTIFLNQLFPYFGVGLSIILVALILLNFFVDDENDPNKKQHVRRYILLAISGIILIYVIFYALGEAGIGLSHGWRMQDYESYVPGIILGAILIGFIISLIAQRKP